MSTFKVQYEAVCDGRIPVSKYKSLKTGLTVCFADIDGPIINGYICLGNYVYIFGVLTFLLTTVSKRPSFGTSRIWEREGQRVSNSDEWQKRQRNREADRQKHRQADGERNERKEYKMKQWINREMCKT